MNHLPSPLVLASLAALGSLFSPMTAFAFDDHPFFNNRPKIIVKPRIPDSTPGSGLYDAGTIYNPFIVKTPSGQQYEMKARIPDPIPHGGMFDPGTIYNPFVIEER